MGQEKTPEEIRAEALAKIKLAMRRTTDLFDGEINDLIDAAMIDLGIAGVSNTALTDALILQAVTTYCKMKSGEPEEYDRLKASYDEQKAQLRTATNYTTWG